MVHLQHGLRAGLTPVVTLFGLDLAALLGGAVITETVFNLPGIGQLRGPGGGRQTSRSSRSSRSSASAFIIMRTCIVDILYAVLDPRVRYT